jgi:CRISPR-associated protein Csd1
MLELLIEYANKHLFVPESGFKEKRIRWAIVFDDNGKYLDVVELGDTSQKSNIGEPFGECPHLDRYELFRGGITRSQFLADTNAVVALFGAKPEDVKVKEKHSFFIQLLNEAGCLVPGMKGLAGALQDDAILAEIRSRLKAQKAKPGDLATLKVGNEYLLNSHLLYDWWRSFRANSLKEEDHSKPKNEQAKNKLHENQQKADTSSFRMRCFASANLIEPLPIHPEIRGLANVGGNTTGSSLIGFDKEAFCSYGFTKSENAAVSDISANIYRAALDYLIEKHGQPLAGAKVVHWFKDKISNEGEDPFPWLLEPEHVQELNALAKAKDLLQAIKTGNRFDLADNYYYAMTLSGAGGRVMVRDWMVGQFEDLVANLTSWFSDLNIVNYTGLTYAKLPGIERVITCLLAPRKPYQDYVDWVKPVSSERLSLWHAAIRGDPIAHNILARVVLLNMESKVNGDFEDAVENRDGKVSAMTISLLHTRMALLKAYHIRKHGSSEDERMGETLKPNLNENHPQAAYHCGRLLAVLARLQRAALGDVGAGIVQRYYAAASSTPALVLGRLTRTSQFHINKLEPGLAYWYESKLADIWGRIRDEVPATLSLEAQSLFALGYYQQLAEMWPKKSTDTSNEEVNGDE